MSKACATRWVLLLDAARPWMRADVFLSVCVFSSALLQAQPRGGQEEGPHRLRHRHRQGRLPPLLSSSCSVVALSAPDVSHKAERLTLVGLGQGQGDLEGRQGPQVSAATHDSFFRRSVWLAHRCPRHPRDRPPRHQPTPNHPFLVQLQGCGSWRQVVWQCRAVTVSGARGNECAVAPQDPPSCGRCESCPAHGSAQPRGRRFGFKLTHRA
eukprot:1663476-Rhodomonas_salina.2